MKLQSLLKILITISPAVAAYSTSHNQSEYEYIVVGSGTGGGTVAATLARKGHSVLLIEAGGDRGDQLDQMIPALAFAGSSNEQNAWNFWVNHYRNQTQGRRDSKYTYRLPDGSLYYGLEPPEEAKPLGTLYPRGATLGGSGQVNALNWAKASDKDWNWIANYTSDQSWSANSMNEYFLAVENCTYCDTADAGHGRNGFISSNRNNITYITGRPIVAEYLSNAILETEGITVKNKEQLTNLLQRDVNSKEHSYTEGAYQLAISMDEMRRRSGPRNYITDTVNAGFPLTVSTHSLATRILFRKQERDEKPAAYGVEYLKGEGLYAADDRYNESQSGELKIETASKEIIIAGGAINTPQILKLSGVGPREELETFGIEVVVDSPAVGKFLQDHPEGVIRVNASNAIGGDPQEACTFTLNASDPCFVQWESGYGPYGDGAAPILIRHKSSTSENGDTDLWMWGFAGFDVRGFYPGFANPPPAPRTISMSMLRTQTLGDNSNGAVTLRSANPRDVPNVDFDWLTASGVEGERELNGMIEGAELLYKIFDRFSNRTAPITRVQPAEGVDLRQNLLDESFGHHAGCSCRMGTGGIETHCADPQLRVNGVTNLRIVDASVFPRIIGSFPQLPITMLARKAADMISEAGKA